MSRLIHALILIPIITACGNSGSTNNNVNPLDAAAKNTTTPTTDTSTSPPAPSTPDTQAMYAEQIAQADGFCVNQKKLQIISTSLLSAYSPKGNGSDLNYCGGENVYSVDGGNFTLQLNNYCVNARGQQVVLNGHISGVTDSGANFFSTIIDSLNIKSLADKSIDWDISGSTRDGRADDNFVDLQVTDNNDGSQLLLNDTSIKKGEFDFGDVTFDGLSQIPFKFIDYFNADNTTGLLFLYGQGDDYTVVSGDNGMITAVYKKDRHDPGTWLDLPCNN